MRFTIYRLPFTMRSPFTVNRSQSPKTENGSWKTYGKRKIVNGKRQVVVLLTISISLLLVSSVHAAGSQLQGITVSPAFQQVNIPQGQTSVPIRFTVTNHETKSQSIKLSTQDFNTLSETGGLVFVGSNPTQLQKKYGLAKWVDLPQSQLTIQPGQTATINADILNLADLNPGGHYGALMLSLNSGSQPSGSVNLHPIASSLLFVTKIGGDTHKLGLASVEAKHNLFRLPSNVTLRFHNIGNTHVVPRGLVTVTSPNGHVISKGIINQNSDIVLPETYRQLTVPLQPVSQSHALGKYKLTVDFRFDGFNQYRRYQTGLWIIPWYYIAALAAFVIIIGLSIKAFLNLRTWRK